MRSMKAAVLHALGDLRIEEVGIPKIEKSDDVIVRVRSVGICGSDVHRIMTTGTYRYPLIPGHEFSGQAYETGKDVTGINAGDRVVAVPIKPCFVCDACQKGHYGQCADYDYIGSRCDGAFAEYVRVPARNIIRIPDSITYQEAAVVEPSAVSLHGICKVKVESGDTVIVFGCGVIGLLIMQLAKIMGAANIIAVDILQEKLEYAHSIAGAVTVNANEADPIQRIMDITGNKGGDLAIETAGVCATQVQCLNAVKESGRVLYLGTAHKEITFPPEVFEKLVRKEYTVTGAWNSYSAPFPGREWKTILQYIQDKRLNVKDIITHQCDLTELPEMITKMLKNSIIYGKVLINF